MYEGDVDIVLHVEAASVREEPCGIAGTDVPHIDIWAEAIVELVAARRHTGFEVFKRLRVEGISVRVGL